MTIGRYVRISSFSMIAAGQGLYLGNFIHVSNQTGIIGGGICVLDDFVQFAAGAQIITGTDRIDGGIAAPTIPFELQDEYRSYYRSFVYCAKYSFVGTNAVILPGVTIGEGAVVGSGAVVTKDLEPWGIYMGIPARCVKKRPKDSILRKGRELTKKLGLHESDFTEVIANFKHSSL
jgi:galactoside O-acetyltransferase